MKESGDAGVTQSARHAGFGLSAGHAGTGDSINSNGMLRGMEQTLLDPITAGPLAFGDVAAACASVREILDTMMPGGGYALAQRHGRYPA